jgi:hypothetical protein
MSFRPSTTLISALLLPVLVAGCAAAPGAEPKRPTPTTAPGTVGIDGVRPKPTVAPRPTTVPRPRATTPTTVAPTTTTPPTTAAPRPGGTFVAGFPGDVAPGSLRWGAAIAGNGDPARHESVAGTKMGLRRTFFSWKQRTGSMVRTAQSDLAAGRLPWVSVKPPSWAAMAKGTHDAEIDEMLRGLDALGGPVWLTVHHEPEGGGGRNYPDDPGGTPAWRGMQERVRLRMTALGTDNIAFAPILMSWTFNPLSGRTPSEWWVDDVWDFAGVDHYINKETAPSVWDADWRASMAFYASKGLKVAVAEWGNRGTDSVAAAEMTEYYQKSLASGSTPNSTQVIGLSYFDSSLNSPMGSWELQGAPLTRFRQIMQLPTSIHARETA